MSHLIIWVCMYSLRGMIKVEPPYRGKSLRIGPFFNSVLNFKIHALSRNQRFSSSNYSTPVYQPEKLSGLAAAAGLPKLEKRT
jgi:hypothetical protein